MKCYLMGIVLLKIRSVKIKPFTILGYHFLQLGNIVLRY